MKLGFTEFSYGYAFTESLIRSSSTGPAVAPVFPNLVQEGQLGYDMKIDFPGAPLFFQFKLPEWIVRGSAKEISIFHLHLEGLLIPFFRMPLMQRSHFKQHALLIELEERFPNSVFYASPRFCRIASFNRAYSQAKVHLCSVLFSPNDIGCLPDNKKHWVSYSRSWVSYSSPSNSYVAWRCSEPKKVKAQNFEAIARGANEEINRRPGRSLRDTAGEIREVVLALIPSQLRETEEHLRERIETRLLAADGVSDARAVSIDLLVTRELARIGLGLEMLIAQPRRKEF